MPTDHETESPLDAVPADISRGLVRRVPTADRDPNREIYEALATE